MTREEAQRKVVRMWGYRGATIAPHEGSISPVYEVGRLYYFPSGGARFVCYGSGPSWRAAFRAAAKGST